MSYIEIRVAFVPGDVEIVRWPQVLRPGGIKRIAERVNRVAPCVVRVELKAAGEAPDNHYLQAIVTRIKCIRAEIVTRKCSIDAARGNRAGSRDVTSSCGSRALRECVPSRACSSSVISIDVQNSGQLTATRVRAIYLKNEVPGKPPLHSQTSLLGIRRNEILIHVPRCRHSSERLERLWTIEWNSVKPRSDDRPYRWSPCLGAQR